MELEGCEAEPLRVSCDTFDSHTSRAYAINSAVQGALSEARIVIHGTEQPEECDGEAEEDGTSAEWG